MDISRSKALLAPILLALLFGIHVEANPAPKRVLLVTVTAGYWHSSIPTAERILTELAHRSGDFTLEYARVDPRDPLFKGADGRTDPAKFTPATRQVLAEKMNPAALSTYDGIIFANTTGELPLPDRAAFLNCIKSGKGFVGIHAATDTLHEFAPYIQMIGAEFSNHGAQNPVAIINADPKCPACLHLPGIWTVGDEFYVFQNFQAERVHELLRLEKSPLDDKAGDFPVSWCKSYGKGRVFYTALGHREDVWDAQTPAGYHRVNSPTISAAYQEHLLHGIKWVLHLEDWNGEWRKKVPQ